jgi:hypothetical protein
MKKNLILLLSVSLIAFYALSCATIPLIVPKPLEVENIETVNATFDEVYNAFIQYFTDKGYSLKTADKFTGNIVTNDIEITDRQIELYYRDTTGDKKEYLKKGMNFGYCDCGLPKIGLFWKNLFYTYTVDIKKVDDKNTQFRVKTKFWTELYKPRPFAIITYEGDWECASSGEYEKKVIEEVKTNYLKKK